MAVLPRLTLATALLLGVGIFFALDLQRYLELAVLKQHIAQVRALAQSHFYAVAAAYVLVFVLLAALSLPVAGVFYLTGGALFGTVLGALLGTLAAGIAAVIALLLGRYLYADWIRARFAAQFAPIDAGVRADGAMYLFTLRLMPTFPYFVINNLMALTPIRVWTFWWVSSLALLPGALIFANAGTQLAKLQHFRDVLSWPLLTALVLLGLFPWFARGTLRLWHRFRHRRGPELPLTPLDVPPPTPSDAEPDGGDVRSRSC